MLDSIEEFRQAVHEFTENRIANILLLFLFYGTAAVTVVGLLLLIVAWYLTKE